MKRTLLYTCLVFVFALFTQQSSAQGTYNICTITSTTDTTGTLYDTGGPSSGYQTFEDCSLLVQPTCADTITLTFSSFDTESGYDYFTVYDGTTTTAPMLMHLSGQSLSPPPVVCTSGSMLITWVSDVSIVYTGFACSWTTVIHHAPAPTAAFNISNVYPPLNVGTTFTDQSVGNPTGWIWDFGDGDTSHHQNPTHAFANPGDYLVTLYAFTCDQSDTITDSVHVQVAPQISVSPDTLSANVQCGDIVNFNLDVSNIAVGGGQLYYTTDGTFNGNINVLAMSYGTNQFTSYPRTFTAINHYFTSYNLTTTPTIDPGTLNALLINKNVLLIPEQDNGDPAIWTPLGPVIRQFLSNGGSVVWCGSYSSEADCMFNTGAWSGSFANDVNGGTVTVVNPAHPLAANVPGTFSGPDATFSCTFTDANKETIMRDANNDDVVATHIYNAGKAIYVGFDFFSINNANNAHIIANAIQWGGQNNLASWVHLNKTSDTVDAGNTSTIQVTFQTTGLPAGTYVTYLVISNNDPATPTVLVPCTLTVSGLPIIALSDSCLDFGTIMQHTNTLKTFQVVNNGCDTLKVTGIASGNADFTEVTPALPFNILPGGFTTVTIRFQSSAIGLSTGTLTINDNDNDTTICLSGTTFAAPIASSSSTLILQSLPACGDTASQTFTINNTGGTNLTWSLGSLPAWATASPTSGTTTPGNSTTITVHFNTGTLSGGSQSAILNINSNDPLTPTVRDTIKLTVGFNPCVSYNYVPDNCTGQVNFTSSAINNPTSYTWDFGDSHTDNVASPIHFYSATGTYTVQLIACNGSGCDTTTQTVNAQIIGPRATTYYPVSLAPCCNIGITNVTIGHINRTSTGPTNPNQPYSNFTCSDTASVGCGTTQVISITTGPGFAENVYVWVDWNDDGILDSLTELAWSDQGAGNVVTHLGFFTVPSNAPGYTPLRMRIADDFDGNPPLGPYTDPLYGEVEDYTLFIVTSGICNPPIPVGTNDLSSESVQFGVSPNPFNNETTIEYNLQSSSKISVEVFDVLGKSVVSYAANQFQAAGKHTYQFSNSVNGVYFVKLTIDGKSSIQKIVKM